MAKGVYKEWIEGEGLETICKWAKLGLDFKQIAANIGITAETFSRWLQRFPQFEQSIKKARKIPNLELENAMFDLACGRVIITEELTVLDAKGSIKRVERFKKQVPPNHIMQIFLAKNRMRERYKDYAAVKDETAGSNDESINVQVYLPEKVTNDDH